MAIAYGRLRDYLGLPKKPIRVYDMVQQLAVIDTDVLDRFGVDTVELGRGFSMDEAEWKEWVLPDGSPCLIPSWVDVRKKGDDWYIHNPAGNPCGLQRKGMLYFDQIYWPYKEGIPDDLSGISEAIGNIVWSVPSPPHVGNIGIDGLAKGAQEFRASTDRALIFLFGGNLLEMASFLCSIENAMMWMALEPEKFNKLLDAVLEIHLANIERLLSAVSTSADIVLFGDDLGMQVGPQVSPDMYREYFKPRERIMWKRVKEVAPHIKIQLHSCGGIRPLIDDLIEAGLEAVNPVQTSCTGMEPEGLKRDFGGRICLWGGGCDTQSVLPKKSPEEIRKHVLERLSILSPGGGFVFQQIHNIMADVPPENIVAMFDAVKEFNEGTARA